MKGLEEYLLNSDLAEYHLNSCLGEEELTLLVLAEIHQIGLAAQGFPKIKNIFNQRSFQMAGWTESS